MNEAQLRLIISVLENRTHSTPAIQGRLDAAKAQLAQLLEADEAAECLARVRELAGDVDWREWLTRATYLMAQEKLRTELQRASARITEGR